MTAKTPQSKTSFASRTRPATSAVTTRDDTRNTIDGLNSTRQSARPCFRAVRLPGSQVIWRTSVEKSVDCRRSRHNALAPPSAGQRIDDQDPALKTHGDQSAHTLREAEMTRTSTLKKFCWTQVKGKPE